MPSSPPHCRACGATSLTPYGARSRALETVGPENFRITDSAYSRTLPLVACTACGFVQIEQKVPILSLCRDVEDPAYEDTRAQRSRQAKRLIDAIRRHVPTGRLLDVGAGTGILVEAAAEAGFRAEGVEPSRWMVARARQRGLPVHEGALGEVPLEPGYDVITLVDVLEHVMEPAALLAEANRLLKPGGILLVVTPDLGSVAARLLGPRWWHFRVAHVGYFNRANLFSTLERTGFDVVRAFRPSWSLPVDYLFARLAKYFPLLGRVRPPRVVAELGVRFNLRDSIAAICRKNAAEVQKPPPPHRGQGARI